jgi:hypothetical protein
VLKKTSTIATPTPVQLLFLAVNSIQHPLLSQIKGHYHHKCTNTVLLLCFYMQNWLGRPFLGPLRLDLLTIDPTTTNNNSAIPTAAVTPINGAVPQQLGHTILLCSVGITGLEDHFLPPLTHCF